ncbi:MAG: 4Fe-4S single cluster domain-containing protein [Candidatus Hodarchaeales archaeon]|jgi:anaerobic ribonucleoside-triphosphate reductase activating protein
METIRLSNIIPISEANGPGPHYTIWVQGCNLRCNGCFNPHTHDPDGGYLQPIPDLLQKIASLWHKNEIKGVTITGGEPLQQIKSLTSLIRGVKDIGNIGIIILTGFSQVQCYKLSEFDIIKQFTDVLIAGPFKKNQKLQEGIRGSSNKEVILFTDQYSQEEFSVIPPIEIFIDKEGSLSITGIKPEILNSMRWENFISK